MAARTHIHGIGINDADYTVKKTIDKKIVRCKVYVTWGDMLRKCYRPQHPNTQPCEVVDDWLRFMAFRKWMETQQWEGRQLNNSLLGDGSIYSESVCVFVPCYINKLFNAQKHRNSDLPLGVSKNRSYFQLSMKCGGHHKVSYYDTLDEAANAYIAAKTDYVRSLYPEISKIDPRLPDACENKLQLLGAK